MGLKFLFIYERFFKTDAGEFTLRSLDVAAADHSCWDAVCVCKHALIYKTLQKPSKYGIQGAISEPVLCRRLSSSHRPNTVRLRPHRVRPLISVYIDLAGCLMATLLLCQWLQLQRVELSRPQQFVSRLRRACTHAHTHTHARPHTSRGRGRNILCSSFPPLTPADCFLFHSSFDYNRVLSLSHSFLSGSYWRRPRWWLNLWERHRWRRRYKDIPKWAKSQSRFFEWLYEIWNVQTLNNLLPLFVSRWSWGSSFLTDMFYRASSGLWRQVCVCVCACVCVCVSVRVQCGACSFQLASHRYGCNVKAPCGSLTTFMTVATPEWQRDGKNETGL